MKKEELIKTFEKFINEFLSVNEDEKNKRVVGVEETPVEMLIKQIELIKNNSKIDKKIYKKYANYSLKELINIFNDLKEEFLEENQDYIFDVNESLKIYKNKIKKWKDNKLQLKLHFSYDLKR